LVTQDEDGLWQATNITLFISLGTADDAIIESNEDIAIVDGATGDEFELFFIVRLTGKERNNGELKSGKLRHVVGIATVLTNVNEECVTSLSISGKLKREENVPQEVFEAVFPPS
jgi:hypothetical protein